MIETEKQHCCRKQIWNFYFSTDTCNYPMITIYVIKRKLKSYDHGKYCNDTQLKLFHYCNFVLMEYFISSYLFLLHKYNYIID